MQIRKLKTKMGFLVLAKHGLNKYGIKRPKLVSFLKRENCKERGREEKERRRKKKKRKNKQSQAPKRYGTTNLEYGSLVLFG